MNDYLNMSEADTRAEFIDKQLTESGWGLDDSVIKREFSISKGMIMPTAERKGALSADYVLTYKNIKLAVIEAKKYALDVSEGVAQAKRYAELLQIRFAYSSNGDKIYQIDMETGAEGLVERYPTPEELWQMTYKNTDSVWEALSTVPYETSSGRFFSRYYQDNAIDSVIKAIAEGRKRILLTLATGTGKTCIAFQIIWKLMQTRWTPKSMGERLPRILFLADRNILANQAFNSFTAFNQSALCRIYPKDIKKNGKVPTSQNVFFTIFQTFMSGEKGTPYFGQYDKDFFDFIVIDECHRGGANDESQWRDILNYFSSAVQLGLTATPKRKDNVDTYKYFGNPVYSYSLKQAIEDGFLTPFRVREIKDNMETYKYVEGDTFESGELDKEEEYTKEQINRKIIIPEREELRVKTFLNEINQNDKTLVFCATQAHAGYVRDLINQYKTESKNPNYCVRVTANDGAIGEEFLRQFQDVEKTIPTILTTSQKLSTGVDAIQIKNIVLMRPVNSMIEFKQIIGRGTRICEGKKYFTVYDFVNASERFKDPEWDGPIEYTGKAKHTGNGNGGSDNGGGGGSDEGPTKPIIVHLGENHPVEIIENKTTFWDASGKPISAEEFIKQLFKKLPDFFSSEEELRKVWSKPDTRKEFLNKLEREGYNLDRLNEVKKALNAQKSDVFDVLAYLAYNTEMITREERVVNRKTEIMSHYDYKQQEFLNFVLEQYIREGVTELDTGRLGALMSLKYGTPFNAMQILGNTQDVRTMFYDFQQYLYR